MFLRETLTSIRLFPDDDQQGGYNPFADEQDKLGEQEEPDIGDNERDIGDNINIDSNDELFSGAVDGLGGADSYSKQSATEREIFDLDDEGIDIDDYDDSPDSDKTDSSDNILDDDLFNSGTTAAEDDIEEADFMGQSRDEAYRAAVREEIRNEFISAESSAEHLVNMYYTAKMLLLKKLTMIDINKLELEEALGNIDLNKVVYIGGTRKTIRQVIEEFNQVAYKEIYSTTEGPEAEAKKQLLKSALRDWMLESGTKMTAQTRLMMAIALDLTDTATIAFKLWRESRVLNQRLILTASVSGKKSKGAKLNPIEDTEGNELEDNETAKARRQRKKRRHVKKNKHTSHNKKATEYHNRYIDNNIDESDELEGIKESEAVEPEVIEPEDIDIEIIEPEIGLTNNANEQSNHNPDGNNANDNDIDDNIIETIEPS